MDLTDSESLDWIGSRQTEPPPERRSYNKTFGTRDGQQRASAAQQFSEGDEVDTPDGPGVVAEIRTEAFEGPDGDEIEPSEDGPAYIVAVRSGANVYRPDDLSDGSLDVEGVDDPVSDLGDVAEAAFEAAEAANPDDGRRFDYPESWNESPTPSRIILLKAWAGLGGRLTSCQRKMQGEVASPARFCGYLNDRVLEWEGWRKNN